jgi:hypothetical protein
MSDQNREKLRQKIEAGEARLQLRERASRSAAAATDSVTGFARAHPLLVIAGGLAIGVALSTLIPRSPTRKLSRKTVAFLASVAEMGLAYGREALEAAEEAGRQGKAKVAELSSTARDKLTDALEQVGD